jgi:hypothetical protein
MEKIKLVFEFDDELTLSKLSRTLIEFNRMINLTSQLQEELKEKLLKLDEFFEAELTLIIEQLKERENRTNRNFPKVEVQTMSMNSPLEMIVYTDISIHIAIILLGGTRNDYCKYTIKKGLIRQVFDIYKKLRD